jgi:hypothetical protein
MLELKNDVLKITLPEGLTNHYILELAKEELNVIANCEENNFYCKDLTINGRITTHLAMFLDHRLAHICNSISLFDPKLNSNITVIKH